MALIFFERFNVGLNGLSRKTKPTALLGIRLMNS
jgi:hypothetical protein